MTDPHDLRRAESHGVDTDRVDGGAGLWRPVALAIAAGLVAGAVVGGLYGAAQDISYDATTALSVLPDSVVDTGQQNTAAPALDATAYIQGQLVSLNGTEVANAVQDKLKLASAPAITATQVGQTYVVDVTATASTQAQAVRIAATTGTVYESLRTTALTKSINASLRSTTARLATVRRNLAAAQQGVKPGANVTPAQTALQTEYERLLTLSSSLTLALPQVGQLVTVQSPAHIAPASLSPTVLSAAIGALAGALLAVLLLVLRRRAAPRLRTVGDIVDLGVPVLLPVVPRTSPRAKGVSAWRSGPLRLVAARLAGDDARRVLVVSAATTAVGTTHTAIGLAAAAAARGPVLLVQTADGAPDVAGNEPSPQVLGSRVPGVWLLPGGARLAGPDAHSSHHAEALVDVVRRACASGWFVVVDAPALADSDLALDCLTLADSVATLVVARGISRPADVLGAAELLGTQHGSFAGVVLNDAPKGIVARRYRTANDVSARSDAVRTPAPGIATTSAENGQHRPRPARAREDSVSIDDLFQSDEDSHVHDGATTSRRS